MTEAEREVCVMADENNEIVNDDDADYNMLF